MFKDHVKAITVEKLRSLLADLSGDTIITPNTVGNLLLMDPQLDHIGYIDLGEESIEHFVISA